MLELNDHIISLDMRRFQAVLCDEGVDLARAELHFLETNDFKTVPHLQLALRPANDSAARDFLSFRLTEVMTARRQASKQLALTEV